MVREVKTTATTGETVDERGQQITDAGWEQALAEDPARHVDDGRSQAEVAALLLAPDDH